MGTSLRKGIILDKSNRFKITKRIYPQFEETNTILNFANHLIQNHRLTHNVGHII